MDNSHRKEFEAQIAQLCAAFPPTFASADRIEAYWRGLGKMPMSGVVRCVDYAISDEYEEDRIPSPKQLWRIYRQLRAQSVTVEQHEKRVNDPRDIYARFADHIFLNYLMRKGCALDVLPKLVEIKKQITENYRLIASEEEVEASDMRDKLVRRWDKVYKPPQATELEKSLGTFKRIGQMYAPENPQLELGDAA
jgi:hypothetical protein